MTPRTILYTGKGGVGKTSVAAATARRCAAAGLRTLAMSTDAAHSLAESLALTPATEPGIRPAADNLWVLEVDAQDELTRHWAGVQAWLGGMLAERGIDRIAAEELTVLPGMDEVFALLRLREQHDSGEWDAIIVDCAPTGETLRMLSFPEIAQWWMERAFPLERQLLAAAPLVRALLDIPLPTGEVFADLQRLSENLLAMNALLRDHEHTSVRLVMTPDRMVIGEAMRTFTYLNLYGYLTDAVVVNRVFPEQAGEYFSAWRRLQEESLELVQSAFTPVPVLTVPYFEQEVMGSAMLDRLGETLFGLAGSTGPLASTAAAALMHTTITQELVSSPDGEGATLRLALPLARKADIDLKQVGQQLVVSVGGRRRTIMLPPTMAGLTPTGARFDDDVLEVTFSRG
jgi:arsenite/tail-anchored protein-transporting ATPase